MKIAFTTKGESLEAPLDPRFGRCPGFLIYDTETGETQAVDNSQNLNAPQGAGIQAAQIVAKAGAAALITGHCGPKAFRTLKAAGVTVYHTQAATVQAALEQFQRDELVAADGADVEGHWV